MHLPVTVQAVLAHDETRVGRTRTRKILQAPYMAAAATSAAAGTGAIATTSAAAGTGTIATTTMASNPAMTLLTQLRTLAVEQRGMV